MTENNIEKEIISIISDVSGFDEEEIKPETNFFKDLEIDSIKAIEITVAINELSFPLVGNPFSKKRYV